MKPTRARGSLIEIRSRSTIMAFDEKLDPDVRCVLDAAAMLDITEYELFHLAYLRWHGERAGEGTLEPFFVAYMFDDIVPPWVRDFARLVQRLYRAGRLDRTALGVRNLPRTREMVSRGMRYGVAIGLVLAALIVVAQATAHLLDLGERCMFPPCY